MTRICVAGAAGRMGSVLILEAIEKGFTVVGALEASENPNVGKTLRQAGICSSDVEIVDATRLDEALQEAKVYITFTTPEAEVQNIPVVADSGTRIVMGTTGLSDGQMQKIRDAVSNKVAAVISPNFSIGVNVFFRLANSIAALPEDYDFSIIEIHHTGKKDAPSGTAKRLGAIISEAREYSRVVHGRKGASKREIGELEIFSARAGGVPGIHDLVIAGPHEMLRLGHTAFSRSVFAQGALYAAEWVCGQESPGIYSMNDVLG